MGNNSSRGKSRTGNRAESTKTKTANGQIEGALVADVAIEPKDVMICFSSSDREFVDFLKGSLEHSGISVWADHAADRAPPGIAGKAVMATKVFVFVVSEESACSNFCEDTVSFAYISNRPILPIALQKEDILETFLNAGLRLTVRSMKWYLFEEKSKYKDTLPEVEEVIRESVDRVNEEESKPRNEQQATIRLADLDAPTARKASVHLERATSRSSSHFRTFWDHSFGDQEEVAWFRFQEAFLEDYKPNLKRMFTDDSTQWLLKLIEREVFEGQDRVTKQQFLKFRGDTPVKHEFWKRVSRLAIESYTMHQVFHMESSVRLAAVENLSKFSSGAVIQALIKLLDDSDPNIRAVAAISLARTEVTNDQIVSKLIASLKDGDRLVRESGCLALGHMKAKKAVSAVVSLWRNDTISHVRAAAEVALSNIGGEEAEKAIHMTKVLSSEIKVLTQSKTLS